MTTAEAVAGAAYALEVGADAVLAIAPYYEALEEREIEGYFSALAEVGLPVMLYNNPYVTGWSLRPELVARLSRMDGVEYIKDTTPEAATRMFRIQELCGDEIEYVIGMDTLMFSAFTAGVRGAVWGVANATPEACVRLWETTVKEPDIEAARALWRAFYPVNRFFEECGYCAGLREAAAMRGMHLGGGRPPVVPLASELRSELQRLLTDLDAAMQA